MERPILMSADNPKGITLDALMGLLIAEMKEKTKKIELDTRPQASVVRDNNYTIMKLMDLIQHIQGVSMDVLETLGPNEGPEGKPRIGPGSD